MKRVVVIGGGVAGLTTALHLKDGSSQLPGGLEVVVLEGSDGPGGNIQTDRIEGFTIERGPNGYLDNVPTTPALVRRLGLNQEIQKADESAAERFLFRNGQLHRLPAGPLSFLTSPVLSLPGRFRVFMEPFARKKPAGLDETIFEFASRRIGREAAEVLIDAMVSGVFAGDIHQLSLASAFPKMAAMEAEHGGLVRALLARGREGRRARKDAERRRAQGEDVAQLVQPGGPAGPGGTLTSFRRGLDTLPEALAQELGESVRYRTRVDRMEWADPGESGEVDSPPGWILHLKEGDPLRAHGVVVAVPAPDASPLFQAMAPGLESALGEFPSAGLAVVALAFDEGSLVSAPHGFGFLIPRNQGIRTLGCLWDSSTFPGRAPEGKVLLRAMIGGAHDPQACEEDEQVLVQEVRRDLERTMGLEAEPLFTRTYRWPKGIGQYGVGHGDRMESIHRRLAAYSNLWMAGSSFYGISMNACIEKAGTQAAEILKTQQRS